MTSAPPTPAAPALREPAVDRPAVREHLPAATWLLSFAIAAEIFSGNWGDFGVPAARPGPPRARPAGPRPRWVARGLRSQVAPPADPHRAPARRHLRRRVVDAANTFDVSSARFALLDRFGLVPFLMFCLAPLVFGSARQRRFLLGVLIVVGAYIGIVNFFEGVGLNNLVIPNYIVNPNVGLHFGRARGRSSRRSPTGSRSTCAWLPPRSGSPSGGSRGSASCAARSSSWADSGSCSRSPARSGSGPWRGTLAAMLAVPRARRYIVPALIVGAIGVIAALALVPGLSSKADDRVNEKAPVWDRYNTNNAALRMVEARPIFGFGWQTFVDKGPDFLRQTDAYPLTGAGLEVHNVFLSHLAGARGRGCGAVVHRILRRRRRRDRPRRGPPELYPWRVGLLAVFVCFLVVANLGPLSTALPNLLLWTWAGIAGAEFFLAPRRRSTVLDDDDVPRAVPAVSGDVTARELS